MIAERLAEFGRPRAEYQFNGFLDWFVHFHNPKDLYEAHPSYFFVQGLMILGALLGLNHAIRKGGRFPWLWLAIFLHGLFIEFVTYNLPDIDNFWHAQTPIIFLGLRLPLYILMLYPVFYYHSVQAVSRLKLSNWAEPFAVGLLVVLIDIPYDIIGVRFNHWSWHDTDPNINDRHYYVPWNSYYFHASFAASFIIIFHGSRKIFAPTNNKWEAHSSWQRELLCCIIPALLGMPGGILMFLPLYHPAHDILGIHSEVTTIVFLMIFALILWTGDRNSRSNKGLLQNQNDASSGTKFLAYLAFYYLTFLGIVIFGSPENEIAIGFHEPVGPCDEYTSLRTAFGSILPKRKYLCIEDNDQNYFNFKCLEQNELLKPKNGSTWYIQCGVPFENRSEYIVVLSAITLLATIVFVNMFLKSGPEPEIKNNSIKNKSKKLK